MTQVKKERNIGENALKVMAGAKKYTMNDIKVDGKVFRASLIPTYFDFLMTRDTPFVTRHADILDGLQEIWDQVFPENPEQLLNDGAIKYIVSI